MTFPMPKLVEVKSARATNHGHLDMVIVVTNYLGNPEPVEIPYGWDPEEKVLSDGRVYDLGIEVGAWLEAHPKFPVGEALPVVTPTPTEKLAAAGLTIEELRQLLKE